MLAGTHLDTPNCLILTTADQETTISSIVRNETQLSAGFISGVCSRHPGTQFHSLSWICTKDIEAKVVRDEPGQEVSIAALNHNSLTVERSARLASKTTNVKGDLGENVFSSSQRANCL